MSGMNATWSATWQGLLRQRLLQWAFPLTVTWSLFLVLIFEAEGLLRLNPFTEGGILHQLFEDGVQSMAALGILVVILWLQHRVSRRWPGFLRLPGSAPVFATVVRLVAHSTGLFVIITVGAVLIFYLFYEPETDPQGQFHIWVWGGGVLYALGLAPTAALFTVWRVVKRRHGKGVK